MAVKKIFMTKSSRKNLLDVGVDLGASYILSGLATDQATAFGFTKFIRQVPKKTRSVESVQS